MFYFSVEVSDREPGGLRRPPYIRTSVHSVCSAKLQEHNIVLITGDAGSGKTSLAKELLKERKASKGDCFQVQKPEELRFATGVKTILIDNIFGQYVEDVAMTLSWFKTIQKQMSKRITFILTSRSDIYFRCKDRKNFSFLKNYEIDISSINLSQHEIERIEKEYELPTKTLSDFGLFQKCEVWTALRNFYSREDVPMISKASLDEVFTSIEAQSRDQYFTILITLVFGNKVCEADLEEPIVCDVAKCIGFVQNKKKLQKLIKTALQHLSDSLLVCIEEKYCLRSNIMFEAACKYFIRRHPEVFIKHSDIAFLDIVSTEVDVINEVHIKMLCKRLSQEVKMLTEKKLFNLLKNERTLREFFEELSDKDEALDVFLNSDFFGFTCWSDNVLSTEFLLRRMKGKRGIIENALDCCSETVCRALKKHLNADSSEAAAIPPSPTIYEEQQGPFENKLTFDALECQLSEFPRLRYHCKLVRGIADRFAKLQTEISDLKIIDFIHWQRTNENPVIYVSGKKLDKRFSFVSGGKSRKERMTMKDHRLSKPTFADFERRSLSCIVYNCSDESSKQNILTEIKKLSMNAAASTLTSISPVLIIVLEHEKHGLSSAELRDMSVNGVQIVTTIDDSELLEYLTSAFEIMLIEYIKLLQTSLEFAPSAKQTKSLKTLKTEADAVVKRLQLASKLPKKNTETPSSMSIPEEVQEELDKYANKIYGYGFRPDEFYVLISDKLSSVDKDTLQKKILDSKSIANSKNANLFPWKINFENSGGIKITKYFGSGSPLLPDQTKLDKFGTLGGFAKINSNDIVGLTNFHVIGKNIVAYVKDGDKLVKLGKSTFVLVPGKESLADVALIEVEKCVLNKCQKPLVNDEDEPKTATIFLGTPDQICPAIVHKKGASTGITQGTVVEVMQYREVLGDRETQSAFLVEDTEIPFSAPGDSGSIVFQNSLSASQEDIEVIAILNGRYKKHDEEEESGYVLCSNMKYVYEDLLRKNKELQFFKKDESS